MAWASLVGSGRRIRLVFLAIALVSLIAGLIWRRLFRDTRPSFESTSIAPDLEQFQGVTEAEALARPPEA